MLAYIALAALQVWRAWQGDETLWEFVPLMALNLCLMGFVFANFGSIAMQPFARIAGAASSFQAFTRMIIDEAIPSDAWTDVLCHELAIRHSLSAL